METASESRGQAKAPLRTEDLTRPYSRSVLYNLRATQDDLTVMYALVPALHAHVYRMHLLLMPMHLAGERMQVHVMPEEDQDVRYYSRRAIEHGEHSHYTVLDRFVTKQLRKRAVILDAEVVVWNKIRCGPCCGSST